MYTLKEPLTNEAHSQINGRPPEVLSRVHLSVGDTKHAATPHLTTTTAGGRGTFRLNHVVTMSYRKPTIAYSCKRRRWSGLAVIRAAQRAKGLELFPLRSNCPQPRPRTGLEAKHVDRRTGRRRCCGLDELMQLANITEPERPIFLSAHQLIRQGEDVPSCNRMTIQHTTNTTNLFDSLRVLY